jgi:uncharacterized protein YjbI with pentapeptide repeats
MSKKDLQADIEAVLEDLAPKLDQIINNESDDFFDLCAIAGLDPLTDFADANLAGVNLRYKDLQGADLTETNLMGANLIGADLTKASLMGANLIGADLTKASLMGANLTGADLTEANLRGASLIGANLKGADLAEANFMGADLKGADLTEASLMGANLTGADLAEANLMGANLKGADLAEANLMGADLKGADLTEANLKGANLPEALGVYASYKSVGVKGFYASSESARQTVATKQWLSRWVKRLSFVGVGTVITGLSLILIVSNRNQPSEITSSPSRVGNNNTLIYDYLKVADKSGKTAKINAIVLSSRYRWEIGSDEILEDSLSTSVERLKIPIESLRNLLREDGVYEQIRQEGGIDRVISVGTASCEGTIEEEQERAESRALSALKYVGKEMFSVGKYSFINLGRFSNTGCPKSFDSKDTSWQRSVIFLGVRQEEKGIDITEAVRERIKKIPIDLQKYSLGGEEQFKVN